MGEGVGLVLVEVEGDGVRFELWVTAYREGHGEADGFELSVIILDIEIDADWDEVRDEVVLAVILNLCDGVGLPLDI